MKLIIVESPTKTRTIKKFLGRKFETVATMGHFRDLPKSEFGIDIDNNFEPRYVIIPSKRKILKAIREKIKKCEAVYLATDPDREGEAIAWHLVQVLSLDKDNSYERIVFHEITKEAIEKALQNPRKIDINLVNAQKARRILDRIVGYKLSPFLWKKVARGLSAGRVQSVAVRLIVEREREIEKFIPQEYWKIEALLRKSQNNKDEFLALLIKIDEKSIPKPGIGTKKEAEEIVKELKGAQYKVVKVEKKEVKRHPLPPFITSTLQQTAWQKFRWSAKFTMKIAQDLYERGFITYHRTDSLNLSSLAIGAAKKVIEEEYGKEYWHTRRYKTKSKVAQEAHEAIRPVYPDKKPEDIKNKLESSHFRLYDLIWRRFLASQMNCAVFDSVTIDIEALSKNSQDHKFLFRASGQVLKSEGFLKVYPLKFEEKELPDLKEKDNLSLVKILPSQHFTKPPSRYSEATLIKTLEKNGIGRPSTYAPIISTIQQRNYVRRENGRFYPQDISFIVVDLLKKHFPSIIEYAFTAKMENSLDEIAAGHKKWVPVIKEFYKPFIKNLEKKYTQIDKKALINETTDKICEKCGRPMVVKTSRFGKFLACTGFPDCRHTEPLAENKKQMDGRDNKSNGNEPKESEVTDIKCEKCGQPMLIKYGRFGKFLACSAFPKCKNTKALDQDTGVACPQCGQGKIVAKRTKRGKTFYACDQYPKCKFALWAKPTGEKCPQCGSLLVNAGNGKSKCSNKECKYVATTKNKEE